VAGAFDDLMGRIAGRFGRVEPRRQARAFVLGLISGLPRKNCWILAEHAGDANPDGMQYLGERACRDAGAVRDDVRGYVVEHLAEPQAVLVVDETGDVKKGAATAGVQRQYTGTAGRVENAQVAVYLTYAGRGGHALIDRRLYLPKSWAGDPARRAAAGIPDDVAFTTKPALAAVMIGAAKDHNVTTGAGKFRADAIAARLPRASWQSLSAGPGLKGHRWYDWAWVFHRVRQPRSALAADPPQPQDRRAGLLPVLVAASRPAGRLCQRRRAAVDHRGELPGRQNCQLGKWRHSQGSA